MGASWEIHPPRIEHAFLAIQLGCGIVKTPIALHQKHKENNGRRRKEKHTKLNIAIQPLDIEMTLEKVSTWVPRDREVR
jgi:hypothetical protein